jgi:hypothetical protein
MKYFGLAALALTMSISASATTVVVFCGSFSQSAGAGSYTAANGTITPTTSTVSCPAITIPMGDTQTGSVTLAMETDYSGGTLPGSNAIATTYTIGGVAQDTIDASGGGLTSNTYGDTAGGATGVGGLPTSFFDVNTSQGDGGFTVAYSSVVTSGGVQSINYNVYEDYSYTSSAPEPGSMMLLGGGLLAAGLIGRKKLVNRMK